MCFRLESSRDDQRVRADVLEREVSELQLRNEELTSLAQEAQSLKDEMDILRSETWREASVSNLTFVLQSFIARVCVSGTRLTAWAAWRRWWTRTSVSWRIWAICAGRCDCWRRGTTCTCSAPASWRRSSAERTPSARSSTPTRDRWAERYAVNTRTSGGFSHGHRCVLEFE